VAGEDVCFEEVVSGFFARVQVYGAHQRSNKSCTSFLKRDAAVCFALCIFLPQLRPFSIVEFGTFDRVAEVVVVDGATADTATPAPKRHLLGVGARGS